MELLLLGIFSSYGRATLVQEGMGFCYTMDEYYGATPSLEH
jgi:hypothetical protein